MDISDIKTKVQTVLNEQVPDVDFTQSETMADDGLLDSLSLTKILGGLAMEFSITIPYEDITPSNFNSVDTIAEMIQGVL